MSQKIEVCLLALNENDAKEIAERMYPTDFKNVGSGAYEGLMIDQNAQMRCAAEMVIEQMLDDIHSEKAASYVMHAFFRREHGREPNEDEKKHLTVHMSTALYALDQILKGI